MQSNIAEHIIDCKLQDLLEKLVGYKSYKDKWYQVVLCNQSNYLVNK